MPRLDVAPNYSLFAGVLQDPAQLTLLSAEQFGHVIDAADQSRLLGWLIGQAEQGRVPPALPAWLRDRLASAEVEANAYDRAMRWEIDRLGRAFFSTGLHWILLKGAAYLGAGLSPGRGRRVADIDILVARDDLSGAERALVEHGWEFSPLDAYDIRYYREWMHELPPLRHRDRRSTVDVHHAILPRTSRLKPSSERLIERAERRNGLYVLCPSHMVLHGAAHLFHDGEIAGAIRDLVDLDQLLREFGRDPAFWTDLMQEAKVLGLGRSSYYALRYAVNWFNTPVPPEVLEETARHAPPWPVGLLMDLLVTRSISGASGHLSRAAALALYVRSHWLRMPPLQVVRHLTRKSLYHPEPR